MIPFGFGRRALLVSLLAFTMMGCGSSDGRIPVAKTSGKLVWSGHPVLGLLVVLHPTDPTAPKTPVQPTGVVHEDGSYEITCYSTSDGAPPGEYIVTIREAPRAEGSSKITLPPARYLDPQKSPLRVTIEKKSRNELEPLVIEK